MDETRVMHVYCRDDKVCNVKKGKDVNPDLETIKEAVNSYLKVEDAGQNREAKKDSNYDIMEDEDDDDEIFERSVNIGIERICLEIKLVWKICLMDLIHLFMPR